MPFWFEIMIKRHFFLKYYCLLSPAIRLLWELFYSVTFGLYRFLVLLFKLIKSLSLDNLELFTVQMSRMMSELNILRTFNQHLSYIIKIIITISKVLNSLFHKLVVPRNHQPDASICYKPVSECTQFEIRLFLRFLLTMEIWGALDATNGITSFARFWWISNWRWHWTTFPWSG